MIGAMGKTPLRAIRVADDIWQAAQSRAEAEGTTVTAVVVASLKRYGSKHRTTPRGESNE